MIFALIAVLVIGGYFGYQKYAKSKAVKAAPAPSPVIQPPGNVNPPPAPPAPVVGLPAGVVLSDSVNGLVSFPGVAKTTGYAFSSIALKPSLRADSQAAATVDRNAANSAAAGAMGAVYVNVFRMEEQTQSAALAEWQPTNQAIPHAETIPPRFDTWPKVLDFITNQWQPPHLNPSNGYV